MINNILKGIKAYTGAFALISKLKLWKYFAVPIVISLVTATIIGLSAYGLSDNMGRFIAKVWVWEWGKDTFTSISTFIGAIVIIAIGLILYKHIIMALSAPFMSPVSEKIEAHLTGVEKHQHRNTSFQEQLWRGIRINVRNLGRELIITIPILLLKFIPIVNIFSTVLLFLVQAYYAGFGNMDYTLERHFKYRESIRFVRQHRGIAIGNGIVFMLFLLIPVIGIILVLPMSVTAASLKTVEILKEKDLLNQNRVVLNQER
ncbi:EI24 domain-containing protein [Winogradskyella forsetii]|uniref:EI24 domain-containing protein n=1 Tax=Winogradskyella forsetii TaxID=2686077 RepID=UPI0015BD48F5|nr:EI24 domain-containing protein [Winogradskyella forsetii]